jgi:hypothetical protein
MGYKKAGQGKDFQDWRLITLGAPHEISVVSVKPTLRHIKHVRGAIGQQHHFAWTAASRREVDEFFASVLKPLIATGDSRLLTPPAAWPQYSPKYYAVSFEDPDGLKFEFVFNPPRGQVS